MKIKILIVAIVASFFCIMASAKELMKDSVIIANEDSCSMETIQSAIDACMLLARAAEAHDTISIRKAKEAMEECHIAPFGTLRKLDKSEDKSLDGHLVFNVAFADSLANGRDAYKNADAINQKTSRRGQMDGGHILTKTILIKAKEKSEYKFLSRDRQELAVVAEPGGLVTTRVHAINADKGIDEWHNDTIEVKKGKNSRKTAFTLPHSPSSLVVLEISNCTNQDISVVVISN